MRRAPLALFALLAACAAERAPVTVELRPTGALARAPSGLSRAELKDTTGVVLATRRFPAPVQEAEMSFRWVAGADYVLRVIDGDGLSSDTPFSVPLGAPTLSVEVEAPIGQGRVRVQDGETLRFPLVEGATASLSVSVTARDPGPVRILAGDGPAVEGELRPGERLVAQAPASELTPITVEAAGQRLSMRVEPVRLSTEAVAAGLRIVRVDFPAGPTGEPDIARPSGRISLPSPLWQAVLDHSPLGTRPRNSEAPWSSAGVTIENHSDSPINLVVRARVLGPDGQPDPVFRPRMRSADDGTGLVSVLLRVPAQGEARAALPVFVDEAALDATRTWTLELSAAPLGSSAPLSRPLAVHQRPLYASRGDTRQTVGLSLALLASLGGGLLLGLRGPRWIGQRSADLVTIALFAALLFVAGSVSQLVGAGVGAILGPFSSLLTGILDDAVSTVLLGTLITLLPRPGTLGLAAVLGYLLRGFALGGFSPFDLLFVTARVFYLELFAALTGLSRGLGASGSRAGRWLRLGLGLGLASAVGTATGLTLQSALYRLSYADWYVVMIVLFPGFLYVLAASGVALRFADSLRRVES